MPSPLLRRRCSRCEKEKDPSSCRMGMLVAVIEPSSASSDLVADCGFAAPSRLASALSACRSASSSLLTRANHLDKRKSSSCSVLKPCRFF